MPAAHVFPGRRIDSGRRISPDNGKMSLIRSIDHFLLDVFVDELSARPNVSLALDEFGAN